MDPPAPAPVPFGEMAWDHARGGLARRGTGKPTEEEIAKAVDDLLDRAGQGPPGVAEPSKGARRVARRTRATARRPTSAPAPEPGRHRTPPRRTRSLTTRSLTKGPWPR